MTDQAELEEERRLAYVGITRAQQRLYLTHAWSRSLFGQTNFNPPSRFLGEIPGHLMDVQERGKSANHAARNSGALERGRKTRGDVDDLFHGVFEDCVDQHSFVQARNISPLAPELWDARDTRGPSRGPSSARPFVLTSRRPES